MYITHHTTTHNHAHTHGHTHSTTQQTEGRTNGQTQTRTWFQLLQLQGSERVKSEVRDSLWRLMRWEWVEWNPSRHLRTSWPTKQKQVLQNRLQWNGFDSGSIPGIKLIVNWWHIHLITTLSIKSGSRINYHLVIQSHKQWDTQAK